MRDIFKEMANLCKPIGIVLNKTKPDIKERCSRLVVSSIQHLNEAYKYEMLRKEEIRKYNCTIKAIDKMLVE